ncbi:alanine/ornithine racemase family PLP-dependent enzyme [Sedimentibacter hydroxybenzoicus DSM 7310]|uniref:Alanine/ornithine racemase family PLP-dependent enzyme n=1 Tax=Sedimentibacter hydroxybenzoicus DSM 7310 TaxID=1123245 RepID=A0A974BMS4_SEDHY|nr:ornithine racemase Orr [Sedimentibacter hydroxybenzoicus]NYB75746.1 alanine/ornithine racemase family PLP-dependent enzyme [Sedimentibacter hydroxybenzoicus DSM 7310]
MYPKLVIDLNKVKNNLNKTIEMVKGSGCSLMIVTKGYCADMEIYKLLEESDIDYLADSRIQNLKKYEGTTKERVLLRLPMISEADDVVRYADISLNSEIETIKKLNDAAGRLNKKHKILLMIDLGDLREGIFFENEDEIYHSVEEILKLENIELFGLGVNLTCYGAVIPKKENLSILVDIAHKIETKFNIKLQMISGGNSSSVYLIGKNELSEGINNLRVGEAFLLGDETAYSQMLEGFYDDAFTLEAEIIELKEKQSLPVGETGVDAFGNRPVYEDLGVIKRAIIAVGRQDVDPDHLHPIDPSISILGASSDHLIVNADKTESNYKVGDIVKFKVEYSSLLRASTSSYVEKEYK